MDGQNSNVNSPATGASPGGADDAEVVYPCTNRGGRSWGPYTQFAESAQAQSEWKAKLEEAARLGKVAWELNKLFEMEPLSVDAFFASTLTVNAELSWNCGRNLTSIVTCFVPFSR